MNPSAIYSKSGKGVQEASGKTSLLKRAERAVLSAIDGRTTLAEVAKKVGKPFDGAFEALIAQLDKDGFVREVGGGGAAAAAAPAAKPAARPATATVKIPAAKPPPAAGEDLDFTGIMATPLKAPPKPAVDPVAAKRAKEQEAALYKARQEAEARAQQERDKARAAAEARARTEAEAKLRADAEAKVKAEAEAKARAAREAAVRMAQEAKAKLEAEAKAKIEAERLKADAERRAREEAERKAKEEAERARREAEELRLRLEEERKREEAERKAREEAERKAKEEAERARREAEELRLRLEEERKAREEAERKAREEAEKAREAAERKLRAEQEAQMRQAREEAERRRAEAERERREAETRRKVEPAPDKAPAPPPEPRPAAPAAGGLDALMADLDSFTQRDNDDRKAREEAEAQAKAERDRKLREEAEQRERERAERERAEAEGRERREEEQRRAREEEERRAREELERARQEAEERARRASEALAASAAQQGADDIGVTDADLGMDDVRRDEAAVAKESRKARREREREAKRLEKEARERDQAAAKAAAKAAKQAEKAEKKAASKPEPLEVKATRPRRRRSLGRPVAIGLFVLLVAGLGALHVMPVPTEDYQRTASAALRQPVRIGSARLSLLTGVELKLGDVRIGEGTRIASVRAFPEIGSLFGDKKAFRRIELHGVTLRQEALAESLFATARGPNFSVERIFVKDLQLAGPVPLPLLDADVRLNHDGSVRVALLHGPEGLLGQLLPKGGNVEFDLTAASFALPFAPDVSLTSFAMKGRATRQGMRIDSWGGGVLGGVLSGTANLRWGGTWQLDGALTIRGINAAVFAPALLSEGSAEGSGKFSMSGADPVKLVRTGRVEGSFTIGKGVLGSVDLARAIRTDGREVMGRTQFVEMNGQGSYDRGAVTLRNVVIGAGALQAGASADISQSGALSGRIVADVRTPSQSLRTILVLGGTLQEPQVRH